MDKSMMPTLGPLQFQRVPSAQVHSQSGCAPKLLLVSVPFAAIHRPSIGLSLLKAVVEERGFHCDIKYLHLDFAKQLGAEQYTYIGGTGASSLLLGDAVFSKALYGRAVDFQRIWCEGRKTHGEPLPPELEGELRRAEDAACTFIDDVVESVPWSDYSIVGFSAMFQTAPSLALARRIKTTVDNPPQTILGGPLCEGDPGEALHRHFGWIDYVCRGEGERLIVALLRSLALGDTSQLARIPGLIYRDTNRNTIVNGTRTLPAILDTLPVPSYDDWVTQYKHLNFPVKEMQLPLETSRGCWWGAKSHCTFCGLNGESLAFRRKNPDRAFSEIMGLKRYGIAQIFAVDNILDHQYYDTLLPRLAETPHGMLLFYEVKANIRKDQVALLRAAGITSVQPGIESLSTEVLRLMRKGVSAAQNIQLLKWAQEFGVRAVWNHLYGFPNERPEAYSQIQELCPALEHLQPPGYGPNHVRLDRFSPLYDEQDRLCVTNVRPSPSYQAVFDLHEPILSQFASFFEYERGDSQADEDYIRGVEVALEHWRRVCRDSVLIHFMRDDKLVVLDTRAHRSADRFSLGGLQRDIMIACDSAKSLKALSTELGEPTECLSRALDGLMKHSLIIHIDGRYLALSVDAGRQMATLAKSMSALLLEPALIVMFQKRMRDLVAWWEKDPLRDFTMDRRSKSAC